MYEEEIKKGLIHYNLPADENILEGLNRFLLELKKWNEHINLTGIKDIHTIIRELLNDAFFVCTLLKNERSILDMGSGSGILSIPISIIHREMDVFSVDKNTKKINFQRHIKRLLKLDKFYPLQKRIETLNDLRLDAVIAKAVGPAEFILRYAINILNEKGRVLILKGREEKPCEFGGVSLVMNLSYTLPDTGKSYRIFEYVKV